jgi:hypothetical protein
MNNLIQQMRLYNINTTQLFINILYAILEISIHPAAVQTNTCRIIHSAPSLLIHPDI